MWSFLFLKDSIGLHINFPLVKLNLYPKLDSK
jgi:hypothetical protein